jgi:hypothetical protein
MLVIGNTLFHVWQDFFRNAEHVPFLVMTYGKVDRWMFLPLLMAFATKITAGVERFNNRPLYEWLY